MSIESILGISASIIAIGTLAFQGFKKYQKKDLSTMFTELADKDTTIKRQHKILHLIALNLRVSNSSISKTYIDAFAADGRSKSAIFHDICIKNAIEPTKTLCLRVLGYDEPTFRKEWHTLQAKSGISSQQITGNPTDTRMIASDKNSSAAIQDWDTDFVYISDMLKQVYPQFYSRLCDKFTEMGIPFGELVGTKDIWCRDYMPIQIVRNKFIGYKYNPDYLNSDDLAYPHISQFAHLKCHDIITEQNEVWHKNGFQYNLLSSDIVLDGGNAVVAGKYIILTDKIFAENNCFTLDQKQKLLDKIESLFGLKPITLSWTSSEEDPYGHSDGMVKPLPPTVQENAVLISPLFKNEKEKLSKELGLYLNIKEIVFDVRGKDFERYAWAYINFLQVGNKILVPSFGLPCENSILSQIRQFFPECIVDTIEMREIANQGGALHCITWNIKK